MSARPRLKPNKNGRCVGSIAKLRTKLTTLRVPVATERRTTTQHVRDIQAFVEPVGRPTMYSFNAFTHSFGK
jgi:hypothetical protein